MATAESSSDKHSAQSGLERILLAARYEFCRAGLAGAKLDLIALEAGVSKQLIHHYFGTKNDLYQAVLDEILAEVINQCASLDFEDYEPDAAIQLFLQRIFDFFVEWPFLAGLFNDQSLHGGAHLHQQRAPNALPRLMERLGKLLERGQQQGIFRQDIDVQDAFSAALMVTVGGFTSGQILSTLVKVDFSDPAKISHWREFSVRFVLGALRP